MCPVLEEQRVEGALADLPKVEGLVVDDKPTFSGLVVPLRHDNKLVLGGVGNPDEVALLQELRFRGVTQLRWSFDCELVEIEIFNVRRLAVAGVDLAGRSDAVYGPDLGVVADPVDLGDVLFNSTKQRLEHVVDGARRSPTHPIHWRLVLDRHAANIPLGLRQGKTDQIMDTRSRTHQLGLATGRLFRCQRPLLLEPSSCAEALDEDLLTIFQLAPRCQSCLECS